ncbi:MAG: methyltransferase [Planctomycetaceae bacterium]
MSLPAAAELGQIITAYWHSQAVYVAAELGIADLLRDGPQQVNALAQATQTNEDALFRLLRALASLGIFNEVAPRMFGLTPLAELLRSDVPGSQRSLARMAGGEQFQAWGDLLYSVRTGRTAFDHRFGKPVFDWLAEHPEQARIFDGAMVGIHGRETAAVIAAYDFSGIKVLADVGGGNGSNLTAVLQAHPSLRGVLFDLPHVVENARSAMAAAGVAARCECIGGNFFIEVPVDADTYMMRHIIHDWNDEQSQTILRCIRRRIPAQGRLLLIESVIPPGNDPFSAKFLDLTMLAIPGGKERTRDEYQSLLAAAGFQLTRIVPTKTEISVIESTPA